MDITFNVTLSHMKRATCLFAAGLVAGSLFQTAAQPAPHFEVASVRLADPGQRTGPSFQTAADSLTIRGLSLRDCIQTAWQLPSIQVTGPAWLDDVRLDILAKTAQPVDEKHLCVMLQALLTERFGLKTHIEKKEMPVFALTVAKGGLKMAPSATGGPMSISQGRGKLTGKNVDLDKFGVILTKLLGRPIVDATGLKGAYDFQIDLQPPDPVNGQASPVDMASMMITALQDQLGLKLESRKDAVEILVVDHAEKTPSDN